MAEKVYDVSLREAMDILGKKSATVRSYVRSNKLSKQYVEGFNGQEMRLNREELVELKQTLKDTPVNTGRKPIDKAVKNTVTNSVPNTASADPNIAHAIEVLEKELENLRKEKEQLRQESKEFGEKNFNMAGQLGYYQNQVETLKDQVKQLTAPAESTTSKKKANNSFWSSIFGSGKK
ncbi:MAG: hypothetical protein WC773_03140 [Patescibacteria group bacterium]|jgi:cysteinyl-tRNA synthetase